MPKFYLTRRATRDLHEIAAYSTEQWGEARTRQYMADLYRAFGRMSEEPQIGELRLHRSSPFLMAPAKQHFAVYKPLKQGIVIATVLHGRRNIESILRSIGPSLAAEIAKIEKQFP